METIGASMGYLDAWAIDHARDVGPRAFAFVAGCRARRRLRS
jgi:glycerol uptake facilitator protein